jgi:hypothetical protein
MAAQAGGMTARSALSTRVRRAFADAVLSAMR